MVIHALMPLVNTYDLCFCWDLVVQNITTHAQNVAL